MAEKNSTCLSRRACGRETGLEDCGGLVLTVFFWRIGFYKVCLEDWTLQCFFEGLDFTMIFWRIGIHKFFWRILILQVVFGGLDFTKK